MRASYVKYITIGETRFRIFFSAVYYSIIVNVIEILSGGFKFLAEVFCGKIMYVFVSVTKVLSGGF
jgi:hypothetical protein